MRQRICRSIIVFALASLSAAQSAQAQSDEGASPRRPVEITPFVSLDSLSSVRTGAAISFAWTPRVALESEIDIDGSNDAIGTSVTLFYSMPRTGFVVPYIAGGVGIEQYPFLITFPTDINTTVSFATLRLSPTISAGAGLKVPVRDNWGVRTDVRWIGSFGERAPEHWRVFGGITFGAGRR